jgi:uncharacterized membrane protein YfcA
MLNMGNSFYVHINKIYIYITMNRLILTFLLGAFVGILGGLQGQAGSLYILTGLMLLNIVKSQKTAAGTALLYTSIPVTLGAAYQYYTKGDVDLKVTAVLVPTVFIFAYMGAKLNYLIPPQYTLYSIAVITFAISIYYFRKAYLMN